MDKAFIRRKIDWALDRITDAEALDRIYIFTCKTGLKYTDPNASQKTRDALESILDELSPTALTRLLELAAYLHQKEA